MVRCLAVLMGLVACTVTAFALDMPPRKAGLWEIKMEFTGRKMPGHAVQQCVDAETDKLMNNFGSGFEKDCTKIDLQKTATGYVFDSECKVAGSTRHSHGTITGSVDSAYTIDVESERVGGRPIPGMPAKTHMKVAAQWMGACKAGQKPGDMVMPNGMTMNIKDVLTMQKSLHRGMPHR